MTATMLTAPSRISRLVPAAARLGRGRARGREPGEGREEALQGDGADDAGDKSQRGAAIDPAFGAWLARGVECCDERHDDEQRFDAFAQENEHGVNDAVAGADVDGFEVTHQGLQAGDVRRLAAFAHDDRQFAFDAGVERTVAGLHVAFKDGPLLD